jgi:long-chain acyl-CoA synthetase
MAGAAAISGGAAPGTDRQGGESVFSISSILPRARSMYPRRLAVWDEETKYDFATLAARVDALARGLAGCGVRQGDRIAILDVNSHRYLEAYYACAQAGFVLLPLNSRLSPPEIEYILGDAAAKVLIAATPFIPVIEAAAKSLGSVETVILYGEGARPDGAKDYETLLAEAPQTSAIVASAPDDICQIYYTSGTTGEPKGVCLTYGNMTASTFDSIVGLGLTGNDVWLHGAPMFHLVDAWSVWAMPLLGAPQVPLHFEPEKALQVISRTRSTAVGLPPTLISMMAQHPRIGDYDLGSLRLIMYGGSPTPLGLLQRAAGVIRTGYVHAYGITETSGITTVLSAEDFCVDGPEEKIRKTGSAGHAVPHIDVEVMDDDGKMLGANEVGEVVVGGARVMDRYWNKPKHTADVLVDGWYHTGDMGYLDDERNLYIVDRKKDMIISGGENIYSVEIENILSTHDAVLEVAVIGVPSEAWGEAVKAIVVPRPGATVTEAELLGFCRGKIAGYKIPKSVELAAEPLPKTGPGKVAKRRLRDRYWEGAARKI